MRRGIVAALVVACAGAGTPALAAAPAGVVYEIVRTDRRAPFKVDLHIQTTAPAGGAALAMVALMERADEGPAYVPSAIGFYLGLGEDTRWRTYGAWPVAPACPGLGLCGDAGSAVRDEGNVTFVMAPGKRVVVGGVRGRLKVTTFSRYWKVREVGSGFRAVTGEQSGALGWTSANGRYEVFHGAGAAAGPYGSMVFAELPCEDFGAGSATLSDGAGTSLPLDCLPTSFPWEFLWTEKGRRWTLDGDAAGRSPSPYRLVVVDLPRTFQVRS